MIVIGLLVIFFPLFRASFHFVSLHFRVNGASTEISIATCHLFPSFALVVFLFYISSRATPCFSAFLGYTLHFFCTPSDIV